MTLKPVYEPVIVPRHVRNHGGSMTEHLGLVLHIQVGLNSLFNRFDDPATDVSSSWWVSKGGHIEEYVPDGITAWAQAAGNSTYNSVETEGGWNPKTEKPDSNDPLTLLQCVGIAHIYRLGHAKYGWPYKLANKVGKPGLAWHGMGGVAWGNHPDCPSTIRKNQRHIILALAAGKDVQTFGRLAAEVNLIKKTHGLTINGLVGHHVRTLLGL